MRGLVTPRWEGCVREANVSLRLLLTTAALGATIVASACGSQASSVRAPFKEVSFTEAGGWSVMASGPQGVTLRFVPNTTFGIGIVLRNHSGEKLALLDVSTPSDPSSLVQQVGTLLASWNPPPCNGAHSCPAFGFLRPPYRAHRPSAIEVRPTGEAAVQLNFEMRGCDAVPLATAGAPDRIDVTYRVGNSAAETQELSLGGAKLKLRMPSRRDCLPRPKSTIAVEGPYATGSGWTMPTSSGDSCTHTPGGALVFASRIYLAPQKPMVRIWIRLPRFRGVGLYRSLGHNAPAAGPAHVTAVVGVGLHGWQHFRSSTAVVNVLNQTRKRAGGRFHATIVGYRHATFRAYGAWRCELGAR